MTSPSVEPVGTTGSHERILAEAERIKSLGEAVSRLARDSINQPHINDWTEAMGNTNPRFAAGTGTGEAPPSMTQAWTMYGLVAPRDPNDPLHAMMEVLTAEGFTGVLGTNCEQTYDRYLKLGEQLRVTVRLADVVGPKQTGMGEGYFVTSISTWYVEHEDGSSEKVGEMLFRVLKFKPKARPMVAERASATISKPVSASSTGEGFVLYPTRNRDNEYFWEGTAAGELRIQKCGNCGTLRHPPGPSCPQCHAFERDHIVSAGVGTVFSYVVHHHPPIPGHALPIRLALVDLDEGVRMVATADADVEIGDRVQVAFRRIDDTLTLPYWTGLDTPSPGGSGYSTNGGVGLDTPVARASRPALDQRQTDGRVASASERIETNADELSEWSLPLTPTLIVSTAIATRDFQDVHHDRDLAQGAGSKDIFMNILTSNGMVERYVTEQLGNDVDLLGIAIRLGAPAYPGDTLTFSGTVEEIDGDVVLIHVQATVGPTAATMNGDHRQPGPQHVTGTVRLRKAAR